MQVMRAVALGMVVFVGACGGTESGSESVAASAPVKQGPHAQAVTKQFTIETGKLLVEEKTYVDGVAMRLKDGAGAVLTEAPLSACAKLSVVARGNLDYDASTLGDKPALLLVRNEEHPQGAVLLTEPYSISTLEGALPTLVTEGDSLLASGDVGDAGWGSIDPTQYGGEKAPHVRLDVKLAYASIDSVDAIKSDSSPEAKWLRDLRGKVAIGTQGVIDASLKVNMEEYSGSQASSAWFDVLSNWANFNVVAVATDKGCATMVVREPGFIGGYNEAIIQTQMIGDVRKVTAAQTQSMDSIEGDYVFGRVEHAKLGGFPVLYGRAAHEDKVGLVVYFSEKPIGAEPFESLVTKQRMLRAVAGVEFGSQYSFSHYELGGPGVSVEQVDAGSSTTNASIDENEISGLIKLGEGDGPHIMVNFRLPLDGSHK